MVRTVEEIIKQPESDLVVNYNTLRHRKGLYSLNMVTGLPGTGKSSVCFRLAELQSIALAGENKITEKNVIDDLVGLAKFAMESKPENINIAIIEEVSVLFPARRAMATENVDLARILDTCRKKKLIIFANAPLWPSIDSHMRAMGTAYIETLAIYKKAQIVVSKMYRLQTNPRTGKTYLHAFKRDGRDVKRMFCNRSSSKIWIQYELRKDAFMEELYVKVEARAKKKKEEESIKLGIKPKLGRPVKLTDKEMQTYNMKVNQKMKMREIAEKLGCSDTNVRVRFKNILKKLGFSNEEQISNISQPIPIGA